VRRLGPSCGHFASIVADVLYDHCLSVSWSQWHDEPRTAFIRRCLDLMGGAIAEAPKSMQPMLARLIEQDWMAAYDSEAGLHSTLAMMSARFTRRFERSVDLTVGVGAYQRDREAFAADFAEFFPDLLTASARHIEGAAVLKPS